MKRCCSFPTRQVQGRLFKLRITLNMLFLSFPQLQLIKICNSTTNFEILLKYFYILLTFTLHYLQLRVISRLVNRRPLTFSRISKYSKVMPSPISPSQTAQEQLKSQYPPGHLPFLGRSPYCYPLKDPSGMYKIFNRHTEPHEGKKQQCVYISFLCLVQECGF